MNSDTTPQIEEPDALERLSPDDEAQRTADRFLTDALAAQRRRSVVQPIWPPGVCRNCEEPCLPAAVYCDAACRDDHEARQRAHARTRSPQD